MTRRIDRRAFLMYGACSAVLPLLAACGDDTGAPVAGPRAAAAEFANGISPPHTFNENDLLIPGFKMKLGDLIAQIEQYQPTTIVNIVSAALSADTLPGLIAFGEVTVKALASFIPVAGPLVGEVLNLLFSRLNTLFEHAPDEDAMIRRIATEEISKNNVEIMRQVLTGIDRVLQDLTAFMRSATPPYSTSMIDNITAKFEAFASICTAQIPMFLIKGSEHQGLTMHALAASAQLSMYSAYLSMRRELALAPDTITALLREMHAKIFQYQNDMQAVLAKHLDTLSDPAKKNDYVRNFYTLGHAKFLASAKTYFTTLHETKIDFRNSMEIYTNEVVRKTADATLPSRTSYLTDLLAICHCGYGGDALVVRMNQTFVDGTGRATHIDAQGCTGGFDGVSGFLRTIQRSFAANQSKGELTDGRDCIWKAANRGSIFRIGENMTLHTLQVQDGTGARYTAALDGYGNVLDLIDNPDYVQSYSPGNVAKLEPGYFVSAFLTQPGTHSGKTCREDSGYGIPYGGMALRHYTSAAQLAELRSADVGLELDLTCGFSSADSSAPGAPTAYPDVMIGKSILVGKRLTFVVTNRTAAPIACRFIPLLADVKTTSDAFVTLTLLAQDKTQVLGSTTLAARDGEPVLLGEDGRAFAYYETGDVFPFAPGVNYVRLARNADLGDNAFRFASLLVVPTRTL
ncbi:insecticidal delta-endotoxin Cry8Ea1 family protein [Burkholderia ubonensis]|uniref:insecticidal delta-endotoxin Cry8Ea1 family protein n=2 Tax=Burkholderia ubonensis TaxID=101571 RepID=UPI0009B390ED|nr:insecticidal delta-endotoxin Cry8Ea1 family protein [Burkholderia ubonensis]